MAKEVLNVLIVNRRFVLFKIYLSIGLGTGIVIKVPVLAPVSEEEKNDTHP